MTTYQAFKKPSFIPISALTTPQKSKAYYIYLVPLTNKKDKILKPKSIVEYANEYLRKAKLNLRVKLYDSSYENFKLRPKSETEGAAYLGIDEEDFDLLNMVLRKNGHLEENEKVYENAVFGLVMDYSPYDSRLITLNGHAIKTAIGANTFSVSNAFEKANANELAALTLIHGAGHNAGMGSGSLESDHLEDNPAAKKDGFSIDKHPNFMLKGATLAYQL